MATKAKRSASAPRHPEKKWGPFQGGVGVAVWLNEVQTDAGPRFFRSLSLQLRRYRDKKTGRPVSLSDYPYMTINGNYGDTWNPTNNKMEAFPGCAGQGLCDSPYVHDASHHLRDVERQLRPG